MRLKVGQLWGDSNGYKVLITSVAKKTKRDVDDCMDGYGIADSEWANAKKGTVFVYSVHKSNNATVWHRSEESDFLESFSYIRNVPKCSCPDCNKHHFPEGT